MTAATRVRIAQRSGARPTTAPAARPSPFTTPES